MSSDTAELLKRHVATTKAMLDNEKPDHAKENADDGGVHHDANA